MELRHLKYFVTIADEGSITKAAESLLIAQPPLSRQLQFLEEELGVSLFVRGKGRQTTLTDAGRRLLPYARQILDLTYQAILVARGDVNETAGSVHSPQTVSAGSEESVLQPRMESAGADVSALTVRAAALREALDLFLKEAEHDGI
ncbi:MAG: LysR family transcriptional regulator [Lachnospiraceae bacterium]|nr:LysR family transcriptional regulator [Lachnospiraceae bacterium]